MGAFGGAHEDPKRQVGLIRPILAKLGGVSYLTRGVRCAYMSSAGWEGPDRGPSRQGGTEMTTYNIPTAQADRYRLTALLLDIRAGHLDAGHDVSAIDGYLQAIVDAEVAA